MARSKYDGLIGSRGRGRAAGGEGGRGGERRGGPPAAAGSPPGKRSDGEYRQVSAYVRKDTHRKVKMALLEDERQFSELVEELLRGWLASRA